MDPRELVGMAGVPVVVALVEVVKGVVPGLGERWYPVVSLVVGVGFNVAVSWYLGGDLFLAGVTGLVAGLAASGLYSGGRAVAHG